MSKLVIPGVIAQTGNGGGGGGTVDQTYDPTSTNAQSGTAVAEALEPALENKSTATNSLIVSPSLSATKNSNYATVIQNEDFSYTPGTGSTAIGYNAGGSNSYITCVGYSAQASSERCTSIGCNSSSTGRTSSSCGATALGTFASATWGTAVGSCTHTGTSSLAVGRGFDNSHRVEATAFKSIAIGIIPSNENVDKVEANANEAIQIGTGINSTAKTLQVYEYPLLDGNTGKIFSERLPSGNNVEVTDTIPTPSSSNVGQVKLYSGTTTSNFTNGYLYQCKLESTLEETVTFDSDKVVAIPEIFWLIVKLALPETYSNVTNGYITYNESANLVTFTFKDANGNVLGEFPADVGEISSIGITFNNLVDGDVINFTCSSSVVESYKWEPVIVQESSEIKVYNAASWSENTTLFPNRSLPLPNVDDLTNAGLYRVKFNCSLQNIEVNLDYLCQVSAINASGTIIGHFQTLQVFYPSLNDDRGISVTLYRAKQTGSTWSDWKSSLVTSVSNNSTDVEYVSAKLFYDTCGNIEALINAL